MIKTLEDLKSASKKEIAESLKQVTIADDLTQYINWGIKNGSKTKIDCTLKYGGGGRAKGIHPSAIKKGACPLKLYYDCTGEVQKESGHDSTLQRTFDIGSLMHELFQTQAEDMYGDQFEKEVPVRDKELHIVGHTDGLFDFSTVRFLWEIKSIKESDSQFGFAAARKKPQGDHVWQSHSYMYCTNVPFTLIFYGCKNNSELAEQPIVFDWDVWAEVEALIKPVVDAVYNGGPMIDPTPGAGCYRCDYLQGCEHGRRRLVNGSKKSKSRDLDKIRRVRM